MREVLTLIYHGKPPFKIILCSEDWGFSLVSDGVQIDRIKLSKDREDAIEQTLALFQSYIDSRQTPVLTQNSLPLTSRIFAHPP